MKRALLSIILVLFACSWASAETSVWKAQKGDSVLYLGGTCHVLRASDFPLPPEFENAYRASQVVVLETDLGLLNDPATVRKTLEKSGYADGSTLDKHLSATTYAQLSAYCKAHNIPLAAFSHYRVPIAMVSVTFIELAKLGIDQKGVDDYFFKLALKEHKRVEGLETADEQMELLLSMADGDEDRFVRYSLKDLESLKERFAELTDAWRKGDAAKLNEILVTELKMQAPGEYRKLITDRNNRWLPVILGYRDKPQIRLVLVGAAHLVGPDGLIEALRKKGYRVEKL